MRRYLLCMLMPAVLVASLVSPAPASGTEGAQIHCVEGSEPVALPGVTCSTQSATIQAAVDLAVPGDAVLIGAGEYREAVVVDTPDLIIRGVDRNAVRLNGGAADGEERSNGFLVTADGVEISNLTAHHYQHNGIFWTGRSGERDLRGYHGRYVTVYNNGFYGIYAYAAVHGLFEHSYASGSPDAGFYIGECNPCHAEIRGVVAENNALGYSGTNANNYLTIRDSVWRNNGAGIVPNTLDAEKLPPQCCIVIENNVIEGSGNPETPSVDLASAAIGIGIAIAGGNYNVVRNNTISFSDNPDDLRRYGIAVFPMPEEGTPNLYRPAGNIIENNTVTGETIFDLALAAPSGDRNCFSGNSFSTSDPPLIEETYPCDIVGPLRNSPVSGGWISTAELAAGLIRYGDNRGDWRTVPAPGPQPTMPDPTAGLPS